MNGNERPLLRAIRGPVTLITIGVLFALNNFTAYRFDQTWPVILIVFGALSLLGRSVDRGAVPPPPYPPQGYGPPVYTPPPSGSTPQGSYTQSPYAQPGGTAKGGFGTTAPVRDNDPGSSGGTR
jgi:hypothetical protein